MGEINNLAVIIHLVLQRAQKSNAMGRNPQLTIIWNQTINLNQKPPLDRGINMQLGLIN
jgi:hypothetical protein